MPTRGPTRMSRWSASSVSSCASPNGSRLPLARILRCSKRSVCGVRCKYHSTKRARAASTRWPAIALLPLTLAPALAFDDTQFCVAAKQVAIAADKDVGIWIDRNTRNAGMAVNCNRKVVEFTRFAYIASASMSDHWKTLKALDWNATQCKSVLWREAIDNGWTVILHVATADGGRATFKARCN